MNQGVSYSDISKYRMSLLLHETEGKQNNIIGLYRTAFDYKQTIRYFIYPVVFDHN